MTVLDVLEAVTNRRDCGHGYIDVIHVAPAHFDGPACPRCSDAPYADAMQQREPCVICAALREEDAELEERRRDLLRPRFQGSNDNAFLCRHCLASLWDHDDSTFCRPVPA